MATRRAYLPVLTCWRAGMCMVRFWWAFNRYVYDNYPKTPEFYLLTPADMATQLHGALDAGGDGLLLWGAVDNSTNASDSLSVSICTNACVHMLALVPSLLR